MKYKISELPPHIQYALSIEVACIELRKRQIENYEKKIELMLESKDREEVNKLCGKIPNHVFFDMNQYQALESEWEYNHPELLKLKLKVKNAR